MEEKNVYSSSSFFSPGEVSAEPPAAADAEVLHAVYSALLGHLVLFQGHRADLRRRGLNDDEIDHRGYRSYPAEGRTPLVGRLREQFGEIIRTVPGIIQKEGGGVPFLTLAGCVGLLIPVRDVQGRIVGLRIRPDQFDAKQGGSKYIWLSSAKYGGASPGSPVHVPQSIASASRTLRLTEGELKADVATSLGGLLTVSVAGVTNWRPALAAVKALNADTVRRAFDMDAVKKAPVARELDACAAAFLAEGLAIELEIWADAFKGIDDAILAKTQITLLAGQDAREAIARIFHQAHGDKGISQVMLGDAHEGVDAAPPGQVHGGAHSEETYNPVWKPFPVQALPHIVAEFVAAISDSIQVDPTMVALPALAAIAGCIGNSRVIRLTRTWTEPAIVFGCVIADPSTRKTAAMEWAIAPVKRWNAEKLKEHRLAVEQYNHDFEVWTATNGKSEALTPLGSRRPQPPVKRRVLVSNITVETLIRELQANPRGLFIPRDELRGWFASFGQYAKSGAGADECFWLEVRGKDHHYDRKTGDQTSISIEHLTLSVVGTTQLEIWRNMACQAMYDSGMIPRLLLANPPKRLRTFRVVDPREDVINLYDVLLRAILNLDYDRTLQSDWHPVPMVFTAEALVVWANWCDAGRRQQFEADGEVASMLGKMEAYCARFALLFAVCDRVMASEDDIVEARHVIDAITVADWFREEAMRVYAYTKMDEAAAQEARIMQKVVERGGSITPRELWMSNRIKWGKNSLRAKLILDRMADDEQLLRGKRGRYYLPGKPDEVDDGDS